MTMKIAIQKTISSLRVILPEQSRDFGEWFSIIPTHQASPTPCQVFLTICRDSLTMSR